MASKIAPRLNVDRVAQPGSVEERSHDITLTVAKVTALFSSLAAALYAATQIEPAPVVALFFSFGPSMAVILWLQKDARRTGVGAVQDWGYFLMLAWPVVIPWYAFKTRGRRGWRLTAGLFGLILASYFTWMVVAYGMWYFEAGP
jgi:hypothetical protein